MHHGSIEARSSGPNEGSEFIVRLPLDIPLQHETSPAPVASGSRDVSRCRILVVDDNRDAADTLAMLLRIDGHDIRTAYDGLEAVNVAEIFHPEVVLLDIGLPKLSGYDVARRIRQQPWGHGTTLIALTGWGKDKDRRLSQEAGFNFHMVKPVDLAALEELLNDVQTTVV
jgi:CheY-like chemotaxis protein